MTDQNQITSLTLADAILDLAGALIDLQPPDTQDRLADIQIRMIELKKVLDVTMASTNPHWPFRGGETL